MPRQPLYEPTLPLDRRFDNTRVNSGNERSRQSYQKLQLHKRLVMLIVLKIRKLGRNFDKSKNRVLLSCYNEEDSQTSSDACSCDGRNRIERSCACASHLDTHVRIDKTNAKRSGVHTSRRATAQRQQGLLLRPPSLAPDHCCRCR